MQNSQSFWGASSSGLSASSSSSTSVPDLFRGCLCARGQTKPSPRHAIVHWAGAPDAAASLLDGKALDQAFGSIRFWRPSLIPSLLLQKNLLPLLVD